MSERRVLVKAYAVRYQRARKKGRSGVLDEFVELSGYNRSYAAWLLRWHGKKVWVGRRLVVVGEATKPAPRQRSCVYDTTVVAALTRLWELLDYVCGKRLAAALPAVIKALERHGELRLDPEVRAKLLRISPASIDRALASERKRYALKSRARTKPGTLLRHQIPLRTFAQWDDARPGFVEIDLVGHDGGEEGGEFLYTLTLTDVATTWTVLGTARNRAQVRVFEALQQARERVPFPLLGIDSDNGGEFINHHLVAYCRDHRITFTRSRPYRKNDNCFVEQKNWSVVRRFIGYARFASDEAFDTLVQLDRVLSDYLNFFMPSMKLVEKVRDGATVHKRYDTARTPLERVLASPGVDAQVKRRLRERAARLNPAELWRTISHLQAALDRFAAATTQTHPPARPMAGDGLRKAASPSHPPVTFPQPLEIAHTAISTPPTAPPALHEDSHGFR
jgi:hypothetical protein